MKMKITYLLLSLLVLFLIYGLGFVFLYYQLILFEKPVHVFNVVEVDDDAGRLCMQILIAHSTESHFMYHAEEMVETVRVVDALLQARLCIDLI